MSAHNTRKEQEMDKQNVRLVDAGEYISMLRELVEEGHEPNILITGSSMAPFLCHERDYAWFKKPDRPLKVGDIVFYERDGGQYVLHRIRKIKGDAYYMVGDNQTDIEGPLKREQIFAVVTKVKRKEKMIKPGDFWWWFFSKVWIRIVPLRRVAAKMYGIVKR